MVSIMVSKTIDVGSIPAAPAKSPRCVWDFFWPNLLAILRPNKSAAHLPFVRRICYNHVVKKPKVQNLFLYRHRYGIGYTVLGLILVSVLLLVPLVSPRGLSQPEIDSALTSYYDTPASLIDLPYHLLQKGSILLFGLTTSRARIIAFSLPWHF